jgi:nitroimidazol reductase NimA-like FMN-containing flavoprotein (pyridoxamine 5'-phosphate oxidase superfamily)
VKIVSGPWTLKDVERHLERSVIPLRLACATPAGWPRVVSLWFVYRDEALWCATRTSANVVRWLIANPRCGFEVARDTPPYRGVRGWGVAEIDREQGATTLATLVDRYLGSRESRLAQWLLGRSESEVALRIGSLCVSSWDYSRRMEAR